MISSYKEKNIKNHNNKNSGNYNFYLKQSVIKKKYIKKFFRTSNVLLRDVKLKIKLSYCRSRQDTNKKKNVNRNLLLETLSRRLASFFFSPSDRDNKSYSMRVYILYILGTGSGRTDKWYITHDLHKTFIT